MTKAEAKPQQPPVRCLKLYKVTPHAPGIEYCGVIQQHTTNLNCVYEIFDNDPPSFI